MDNGRFALFARLLLRIVVRPVSLKLKMFLVFPCFPRFSNFPSSAGFDIVKVVWVSAFCPLFPDLSTLSTYYECQDFSGSPILKWCQKSHLCSSNVCSNQEYFVDWKSRCGRVTWGVLEAFYIESAYALGYVVVSKFVFMLLVQR